MFFNHLLARKKTLWKLYIMGNVKVDEIGVSVGQKERPNGLSFESRSASCKKVVPRFIKEKIRIGWLIYRPDRRRRALHTGSSSRREPGISGWQLDLAQAYTIHTHALVVHHRILHLEKMYFTGLCPKNVLLFY